MVQLGRAFANELARRGFAVLAPDVFLWGSPGPHRFDARMQESAFTRLGHWLA